MEQPFAYLFGCGHPTRLKMGTRTHCGSDLLHQRDTEILCVCLRCFFLSLLSNTRQKTTKWGFILPTVQGILLVMAEETGMVWSVVLTRLVKFFLL